MIHLSEVRERCEKLDMYSWERGSYVIDYDIPALLSALEEAREVVKTQDDEIERLRKGLWEIARSHTCHFYPQLKCMACEAIDLLGIKKVGEAESWLEKVKP